MDSFGTLTLAGLTDVELLHQGELAWFIVNVVGVPELFDFGGRDLPRSLLNLAIAE